MIKCDQVGAKYLSRFKQIKSFKKKYLLPNFRGNLTLTWQSSIQGMHVGPPAQSQGVRRTCSQKSIQI